MSDICELCGCPEGVDGHDVLTRKIDELETALRNSKVDNVFTAIGSMDAEERSMLCKMIADLEAVVKEARKVAVTCDYRTVLTEFVYNLRMALIKFDAEHPVNSVEPRK